MDTIELKEAQVATTGVVPWEYQLRKGILAFLVQNGCYDPEHTGATPDRVVKALAELTRGLRGPDPEDILKTTFTFDTYDQMIVVTDIDFNSLCEHHLLPFHGVAHFGYVPNGKVVGLSKIPRLVDLYAHRPQVQERLTEQVADAFTRIVQPKGCGVVLEGYHSCMGIRGVKKSRAKMHTTALRGCFMEPATRMEFLDRIRKG